MLNEKTWKIMKIIMIVLVDLCLIGSAYSSVIERACSSSTRCRNAKTFVLIGPSGVGKTTLIKKLLLSEFCVDELISYTTRPMRSGEKNRKDYFFVKKEEYNERKANNEFILSTCVHGNLYGISKKFINEAINKNRNLITSLNTEAARKFKSLYGEKVATIFITPPSLGELKKRLITRGEKNESFSIRLKNAETELSEQDSFDYKIVNENLDESFSSLKKIFFSQANLKLIVNQSVPQLNDPKSIRAMSYNIRMAPCNEDEGTENSWGYRLPKVNMIFNEYIPDIVGIQEVSLQQMESLEKSIYSVPYKFVGKYPTRKPLESGLGIIYNSQKLDLISEIYTRWLNESQTQADAPAWDGSSYERYVIYAKFKNIVAENNFWFMTTHFDHLGMQARQESAKIVMNIAEKLDAPTLITGDFNCFPQAGGQELYKTLSSSFDTIRDSGDIASSVFGVEGSWIGWDYDVYKQTEGYAKYDFIFVKGILQVFQHVITDDRVWDSSFQKELYPSDHRPVLSDVGISS